MSKSRRSRLVAVVGVGAAVGAMAVAVTGASAAPGTRALSGSVPPWATPAARVGPAPAIDNVAFRVYLAWNGGNAAANRVERRPSRLSRPVIWLPQPGSARTARR